MATIIPEVGDWVTLETDMPGLDSEAGKVLEINLQQQKFYGQFFTENDEGPSLEAEDWFPFSRIFQIIRDPQIIKGLEEDYAKC